MHSHILFIKWEVMMVVFVWEWGAKWAIASQQRAPTFHL